MRNSVAALMPKIYELPFNQQLADGTLPLAKFTFYLIQDALYLADYSKALALTARKLSQPHQTEFFLQFAKDALQTERELHLVTLKKYAVTPHLNLEKSSFCGMYTDYLLKMAHSAPVEEAVASLLPCFWVYQQVGQRALAKKILNNPYQDWIDLYASPEFNTSVDLAINTLNELGETASAHTKSNMLAAFQRATQLEYCFWQGAYANEKEVITG
ncbi:thiaminase [Candidatus Rickettsiella viridis]|uniref:Thiaminase n=2 Tax=Candidatus Rickettsiella viridis TaxID=676208 RepID=A0A2Z5UW00_9COXI|nr:thiaminase [Candidatus Rickettsiella viridis]